MLGKWSNHIYWICLIWAPSVRYDGIDPLYFYRLAVCRGKNNHSLLYWVASPRTGDGGLKRSWGERKGHNPKETEARWQLVIVFKARWKLVRVHIALEDHRAVPLKKKKKKSLRKHLQHEPSIQVDNQRYIRIDHTTIWQGVREAQCTMMKSLREAKAHPSKFNVLRWPHIHIFLRIWNHTWVTSCSSHSSLFCPPNRRPTVTQL